MNRALKTAEELFLRGTIALEKGDLKSAETLLMESLDIAPERESTKYNLATLYMLQADTLLTAGRISEALKSYDQAIAVCPDHALAWANRGLLLKNHFNDSNEAIVCLKTAAALDPEFDDAHQNIGALYGSLGEPAEAIAHYDRAIEINPNNTLAWSNKGLALDSLGLHVDALASYERALQLRPDSPEIWNNFGLCLNHLRRFPEALASYTNATKLDPKYSEAWNNRGKVLNEMYLYEESLKCYDLSITYNRILFEAWSNRSVVLTNLERYEEALASCDRSIEINPDYAEAWSNRGIALNHLKRYQEAFQSYDRAIKISPDYADARFNKGLLQLILGQFQEGFSNYRWRWKSSRFTSYRLDNSALPLCDDQSRSKSILLWPEQGIGDEIFYAGLLGLAQENFKKLSLVADKRLCPIFKRSFPKIEILSKEGSELAAFSPDEYSQAPIGDLGYILKLSEDKIKASRRPYLTANSQLSSQFKSKICAAEGKLICGISWKSANRDLGPSKSIQLRSFRDLLQDQKFRFVNLQYGDVSEELTEIRNFNGVDIYELPDLDLYNDIDSLTSLIDACDVIVTTSNITAHIAGSLGKFGCVLVPFSKGKIWYWHQDSPFSLWYPSLKIIYQERPMNWDSAIARTTEFLGKILPKTS